MTRSYRSSRNTSFIIYHWQFNFVGGCGAFIKTMGVPMNIIDTLSKTFYSIPNFRNSSFYTSKVWNSLPALGMQCLKYLLKEVGINDEFRSLLEDKVRN